MKSLNKILIVLLGFFIISVNTRAEGSVSILDQSIDVGPLQSTLNIMHNSVIDVEQGQFNMAVSDLDQIRSILQQYQPIDSINDALRIVDWASSQINDSRLSQNDKISLIQHYEGMYTTKVSAAIDELRLLPPREDQDLLLGDSGYFMYYGFTTRGMAVNASAGVFSAIKVACDLGALEVFKIRVNYWNGYAQELYNFSLVSGNSLVMNFNGYRAPIHDIAITARSNAYDGGRGHLIISGIR